MRDVRRVLASALWLAILSAAAAIGAAQSRRPMTAVDLLEVPRVLDAQLSPDGRLVLYVVERADWKANRRIGHLWRSNADGSGATQLTYGERGESSPRWSPDGSRIAFLTRRGENEDPQIYVLSANGGEARPLTSHPAAISNLQWAADGKTIYFLSPEAKTSEEKDREKLKDDVYAFDENFRQRHLWTAKADDGSTKRVTRGEFSVLEYRLSRDGRKIAFVRSVSPLVDNEDEGEVWVMDADGSDAVQITRNSVSENGPELSPDNTQVLFRSGSSASFESYYNANIFVAPASGGAAAPVIPDYPHEVLSASWASDGRSIYYVGNLGVHSEIFELNLATRTPRQLTNGNHAVVGWQFSAAASRHIFQMDEPGHYGDVWTLASAGRPAPSRVTRVYDSVEAGFALPRQERIEWNGGDGVTIEGLLYYPIDYRSGTRYPLVVQTHGGPQASDKFQFGSWNNYTQVLAAKGYAVLQPNYRGSTGYGNAFLRDMVGHYFNQAHLDVMAGVDRVIEMGVANPDRLVKMGWSGGGHMTNKLITFTNRFKAASSGAGAANWVSMYAQSDTREQRTPWFGGTPWQANAPIEKYWNDSPLKYISNAKTPTLFFVGEGDQRVPSPQSVEMYRALKSNGVPTRLYMAPREPHGWTELRHQLFKINAELEWFEKYVNARRYTWERAPGDAARPTATPTF
jgi:dipeptidyl aminopeptidase/acylaminoacyl peptidase